MRSTKLVALKRSISDGRNEKRGRQRGIYVIKVPVGVVVALGKAKNLTELETNLLNLITF